MAPTIMDFRKHKSGAATEGRPYTNNSILRFCLALLIAAHNSFAQDWPQWRGPNRDGVVSSFAAPKVWPEKLKTVWKVPVGIGHSSPVVVGTRVYIFSRQEESEVATCLDLETGKMLWRDAYPTPYMMNPAALSHAKGPKSTPVFSDNKLYTFGISGILSCYDAATGKLVWRNEFSKQFKATSPLYGAATSPIVHAGLVIVHVGGNDSGALMAFDARTGEVKWTWKEDGPGYASPVIAEIGGTTHLVTQTQKSIAGFSPTTGELLWRIPFETEYVQNIVTPVVYKQTLILSGLDKGTLAIKPVKRGTTWGTEQVWQNPDVSMYMNSPVVSGDYLFGLSHKRKGQFFCLDARTGKTQWTSNGREGDNAATVAAGQFLFLLTDASELFVAKSDSKQLEVIRKYQVAESPTWAHPVVTARGILIKDKTSIALLSFD
ncbi:MAG TPA: PQQ-binding-like beta-propeller repeat protein [Blastocatellia bacterium]|nr:PQQ-binding-like beta-propeller repeat protein [Blastocatellia bacterium]